MFHGAGVAELIRSNTKDEFYTRTLKNSASDILQSLIGPRQWMLWKKEVDLSADLTYFLLTTAGGYQTVGEEYVNIIQVDSSQRKLPSTLRRVLMILIHVCGSYCIRGLLDWFKRNYENQSENTETTQFLLRCIPALDQALSILHRCHLAVFYLRGVFYHIAKRITDIHYVKYSLRKVADDNSVQQSFRALGWLSLAQLSCSVSLLLYQMLQNSKTSNGSIKNTLSPQSQTEVPGRKCSLCLEARKCPTTTPCGHLFCWHCIHEWCSTKQECPLCREKLLPQKLVFLQNFDPT